MTRWRATTAAPAARDGSRFPGRVPWCAGISIVRLLAGKQVDSYTEYSIPGPIPTPAGETEPTRR